MKHQASSIKHQVAILLAIFAAILFMGVIQNVSYAQLLPKPTEPLYTPPQPSPLQPSPTQPIYTPSQPGDPSGGTFRPLGTEEKPKPDFRPLPLVGGGGGSQIIKLPNPLGKTSTFAELINRITNWLLIIGAPILALMIIIGAFQIMTGAGEPEKITQGRHTITYAVIGYALLLLSSGVTTIIQNLLSGR